MLDMQRLLDVFVGCNKPKAIRSIPLLRTFSDSRCSCCISGTRATHTVRCWLKWQAKQSQVACLPDRSELMQAGSLALPASAHP